MAPAANEIQQEIALRFEFCIPQHSVHQAQQDLFAAAGPPRARTPPLHPALGGAAAGAGSGAPADPRRRGGRRRGGRRRRGRLVGGVRRRGVRQVWPSWDSECEVVPGLLVPSLCRLLPRPAPPRVCCGGKEVEFGAKTAFWKVDDHDVLAATVHFSH